MLPNAEAFFLPALEMLAAGGTVVTSNYGGQLDFLTEDNSLLVNGKMIRAPKEAQYWNASPYASMFEPNTDEAAEKLQYCTKNISELKIKSQQSCLEIKKKFSWDAVVNQIESMCV
jgi:glycosyltransferase involved in cell wall biosynthesis